MGEHDPSLVRALVDALRPKCGAADFFEQGDITLAALHSAGDPNLAADESGRVHVAVAGDISVRLGGGAEGRGPVPVASAWARAGKALPYRSEGAFVCVVHDSTSGRCFAFNDFVGQVPLYYARYKGGTYFSSRLAPFLLTDRLQTSLSERGLDLYFSFGCIPGDNTILAGVRKLLPGSTALIRPDAVHATKYWRVGIARTDYSTRSDVFVDRVSSLLDSSVRSMLAGARREVGVLLGGLDSSLVAALMRKNASERIVALTASFEDPRFNERAPDRVSAILGLDLREVRVSSDEIPPVLDDIAEANDEPVSDMIASPVAFAVARKRPPAVTTLFDGTGADDLFQGIPGQSRTRRLDYAMGRVPAGIRNALGNGARKLLGRRVRSSALAPVFTSPVERTLQSWRTMRDEEVRTLRKGRTSQGGDLLKPMMEGVESDMRGMTRDPANISVKTAVSMYFGPTHGFDCSRNRAISYQYGLAVVSPFYDRELYDLGLSIPWYFKTPRGGLSKPLLRKVAIQKKLLPDDIALLRKMGLGSSRNSLTDTQMGAWAAGELSDWMRQTVRENIRLVDHLISAGQVNRMMVGVRTHKLFQVLQFTLWYKRYFGERKVPLFED